MTTTWDWLWEPTLFLFLPSQPTKLESIFIHNTTFLILIKKAWHFDVILFWMELDTKIDRLPIDLLAHIFGFFSSFTDLAQYVASIYMIIYIVFFLSFFFFGYLSCVKIWRASGVCKNWKQGVKESLARKQNLSFAGWKMDDESTARLVCYAYNLKKLDMYVSFSYIALGRFS